MSPQRGCVIGLLGPTGVGKTGVAVELAGLLGTSIISCDSMQVYAGFPVLTNQPLSPEDRRDLHELVGFADAGRAMSAGEYAVLAEGLIEREVASCGWGLLAGGSGLYMRAALAPLAAPGPADLEQRRLLQGRAESEGPEALHAELARLDPEAAAAIDRRNVRRVIRALEGVMGGGASWSGRDDLWAPVYQRPTLLVGLTMDRVTLCARINARTARMVDSGALKEVEDFRRERGREATRPGSAGICSAIGYGEIWARLEGELDREKMVEQMACATRRYARRQGTWLRKVRHAVMIDVQGRDAADVAREVVGLAHKLAGAKEL